MDERGEGRRGVADVFTKALAGLPQGSTSQVYPAAHKGRSRGSSSQDHTEFLRFTVDPATPAVTMDSRD